MTRHGGDEFVILLTDIATAADAGVAADNILLALREPFVHGEVTIRLLGSVGDRDLIRTTGPTCAG